MKNNIQDDFCESIKTAATNIKLEMILEKK